MLKKLILSFCMLIAAASLPAQASPLHFYAERAQQRLLPKQQSGPRSHSFWYRQQVDHNTPAAGTFHQRYHIDISYSDSDDDPVFFYLCGESTCHLSALTGAISEYAKRYHAKLVALEHRYYGESLPRPSYSTEDLQYLSTAQALADAHEFVQFMREIWGWHGSWVSFGGSYPGALSAFYRLQYPDDVVGALASSAPVQAKRDFSAYDTHVAHVAGPACQAKILQATASIEQLLANPKTRNAVKVAFVASDIEGDDDFLYMVADVAAAAVQYGMKTEFCDAITTVADDELVEAYSAFAQDLFARWGITGKSLTAAGAESTDPKDYLQGFGMRPWFYQSCTEFGFWQNASADTTHRARSERINANYHQKLCQRLFAIDTPAATEQINKTYYWPLRTQASAIYFTNGATDPWSKLSLSEDNGNADNPALQYEVIEGAAHCDDLHASNPEDSMALRTARKHVRDQLARWLAGQH